MTKYLLDTNVLLRYFLKDIPSQSEEAARLFRQAKSREIELTIPLIVFFEATYLLTKFYTFDRDAVRDKCKQLIETPYIDIPDRYVLREAYMIWTREQAISLADAVLHCMAVYGGKKLFTFDQKLKRLAKKMEKGGD